MSKSVRHSFILVFLLTLLVGSLRAQKLQTFSTVSIFANNKPTSKECQKERQTLISLVGEFPSPNRWTFFVVCDDATWHYDFANIATDGRNSAVSTSQLYGVTVLDKHITYIRGEKLLHTVRYNYERGADPTPAVIVAHELAHIYLNSTDEDKVEALAVRWVNAAAQHATIVQLAAMK
ncbi:MAG: hypothetical protein ACYCOX_14740 [Acidobacteriaceae bacterium]